MPRDGASTFALVAGGRGPLKDWMSAAEIAALGLAGMPASEFRIREYALCQSWPSRARDGRGGGREYPLSALPHDAVAAYLARTAPPAPVSRLPAVPQRLGDDARRCRDARCALLAELDRLEAATSLSHALQTIVALAAKGELAPHLQALVPLANARSGAGRALSRRSLLRWRQLHDGAGAASLAPRDGGSRADAPPPWAAALLDAFRRPQKPSLHQAVKKLVLPPGMPAPSYHQARRYLAKLSVIERNRGRMGPRALKSLRAFKRRDWSMLEPLDVVSMDGHTFDAEIAHPFHGQPFRPEITAIIDAATRRVVGWSLALAESAQAVMNALHVMARASGIPAILYVDRGSGYEAKVISSEVTGLLARLGITHERSLPYNSQARGLIERLHGTLWVRAAKELPTYIGAPMDAEAKKKVYVLTRRDGSALLMPMREFAPWCERQVAAYNARPHHSLPKRLVDGRVRHLSPDEAWAEFIAKGWHPVAIEADEARELFRPTVERTASRGEIALWNGTYFCRELEHVTGERVLVAYDPADPSSVVVRDLDGRFLAEAVLDGNRVAGFPESRIIQSKERRDAVERVRGIERRAMKKIERARAELVEEIEAMPEHANPPAMPPAHAPSPALLAPSAAACADERPDFQKFENPEEAHLRWCMAHWDEATAMDRSLVAEVLSSSVRRWMYAVDDDTARRFGGTVPWKVEEQKA